MGRWAMGSSLPCTQRREANMRRSRMAVGLTTLAVMLTGAAAANATTVVTTFDGSTTQLGSLPSGWNADGSNCTANNGIPPLNAPNSGCYDFTGSVPGGGAGAGCLV